MWRYIQLTFLVLFINRFVYNMLINQLNTKIQTIKTHHQTKNCLKHWWFWGLWPCKRLVCKKQRFNSLSYAVDNLQFVKVQFDKLVMPRKSLCGFRLNFFQKIVKPINYEYTQWSHNCNNSFVPQFLCASAYKIPKWIKWMNSQKDRIRSGWRGGLNEENLQRALPNSCCFCAHF